MYVTCNITPWLTNSSFMLSKVFCVVSMLSKLPPAVCLRGGGGGGGGGATGLLNKGGGSNRLPVEFPQSSIILLYPDVCM